MQEVMSMQSTETTVGKDITKTKKKLSILMGMGREESLSTVAGQWMMLGPGVWVGRQCESGMSETLIEYLLIRLRDLPLLLTGQLLQGVLLFVHFGPPAVREACYQWKSQKARSCVQQMNKKRQSTKQEEQGYSEMQLLLQISWIRNKVAWKFSSMLPFSKLVQRKRVSIKTMRRRKIVTSWNEDYNLRVPLAMKSKRIKFYPAISNAMNVDQRFGLRFDVKCALGRLARDAYSTRAHDSLSYCIG
mmetsp:Transcript_37469/g.72588  ORF Transcript_37469/g.72588 Transcript_37469/m.72588 type:complete len:246 (-) Transcript_37469:251-988(-)